MKRIAAALLALLLAVSLTACANSQNADTPKPQENSEQLPLAEAYPAIGEMLAARDTEVPVAVVYFWHTGEDSSESPLYGEEPVQQMLDALETVTVSAQPIQETEFIEDGLNWGYRFIFADGRELTLSLSDGKINIGSEVHTWQGLGPTPDFPGKAPDRLEYDSLLASGPDTALRPFAEEGCERPAVIRLEHGGVSVQVTDEAQIAAVMQSLDRELDTAYPEDLSIPEERYTVTLMMADGTEHTLLFSGKDDGSGRVNYIFSFPEPLGSYTYSIGDGALFIRTLDEAIQAQSEKLYQEAAALFEQGSYYRAHSLFMMLGDEKDAAERAAACVQAAPKTGMLSESDRQESIIELSVEARDPADKIFFKILDRNGTLVGSAFVNGSDSVQIWVPEGYYSIVCGEGEDWYGLTDAFGAGGAYSIVEYNMEPDDSAESLGRFEFMIQKGYITTIAWKTGEPGQDPSSDEAPAENFPISYEDFLLDGEAYLAAVRAYSTEP